MISAKPAQNFEGSRPIIAARQKQMVTTYRPSNSPSNYLGMGKKTFGKLTQHAGVCLN
jgi:hypothetical protein